MKLRLTDQDFAALGSMDYILNSAGARYEGVTDPDGRLEVDVPEAATSLGLTVFTSKRPKGRQIRYQIRLDPLPPPDTIRGVKARLQNLGYYWGNSDDVLEEIARRALMDFQREHQLEPTGEADEATQAMLIKIAQQ